MPDRELSRLNAMSADSTQAYFRRVDKTALEMLIGICLRDIRPREMVAFLRAQADMLEEDLC